jgi:hypothetical protein
MQMSWFIFREAHVKPGDLTGAAEGRSARLVGLCGASLTAWPGTNTSYTLASPVPPVHLSCHLLQQTHRKHG